MIPAYINDKDAIVYATFDGNYNLVKKLIESSAPINIKNKFGETALIVAVEEGWVAIAELLLENGANVNLADDLGDTPLAIAEFKRETEMIELLNKYGAKPFLGVSAREMQADSYVEAVEGVRALIKKGKEK